MRFGPQLSMIISVVNAVLQTWFFSAFLAVIFFLTLRYQKGKGWFSPETTTELKGAAILMVVLSHIGYFLVNDHRFLWPLSTMAGLGVNLFLFLSGYGLTASQQQKDFSPSQFYFRRLPKIFIPFWLSLIVFLILDFFILGISRSGIFLWEIVFGVFRRADILQDFNSPLWYFTFILGYYLIFPIVFIKKKPWLSALVVFAISALFVYWWPDPFRDILHMYQIHLVSFPLGMIAAWMVGFLPKIRVFDIWRRKKWPVYYFSLAFLLFLAFYFAAHSAIGRSGEQAASIIAVLATSALFALKRIRLGVLYWFGLYSYEIYLWHWPIMYRYDFLYRYYPAWLATAGYLVIFLALGWLTNKISGWIIKRLAVS